jgi:hypothetical protein
MKEGGLGREERKEDEQRKTKEGRRKKEEDR